MEERGLILDPVLESSTMSQIEVQVLRPRHQDLGHGKSTTYVLKQEDDATVPLSKLLLKPNSLIRLWSAPTAGVWGMAGGRAAVTAGQKQI